MSMFVLVGIVLVTGEPLTLAWLLVVPALLLQSIFNAGLALIVARLGTKITDLTQLMPFILRTWMYGSGVIYSIDSCSPSTCRSWATTLLECNPLRSTSSWPASR